MALPQSSLPPGIHSYPLGKSLTTGKKTAPENPRKTILPRGCGMPSHLPSYGESGLLGTTRSLKINRP